MKKRFGNNRKHDEPQGYHHRLFGFIAERQIVPGVHVINVHHEDGCRIFETGQCTCKPDISSPTLPGKN